MNLFFYELTLSSYANIHKGDFNLNDIFKTHQLQMFNINYKFARHNQVSDNIMLKDYPGDNLRKKKLHEYCCTLLCIEVDRCHIHMIISFSCKWLTPSSIYDILKNFFLWDWIFNTFLICNVNLIFKKAMVQCLKKCNCTNKILNVLNIVVSVSAIPF